MKTNSFRAVLILGYAASCAATFGQDLDHSAWSAILRQYVTVNSRVDYAGLKAGGSARLDAYIEQIARPRPATLDENARKAALINAYNALTIRWMVSNFPVNSIWRTEDPFRVARHHVNGRAESLDSIETRLRNMGDPRIHGALVCAARSCLPLRREAYTREAVDGQLDDNFRVWLADDSKNQFLPSKQLTKARLYVLNAPERSEGLKSIHAAGTAAQRHPRDFFARVYAPNSDRVFVFLGKSLDLVTMNFEVGRNGRPAASSMLHFVAS